MRVLINDVISIASVEHFCKYGTPTLLQASALAQIDLDLVTTLRLDSLEGRLATIQHGSVWLFKDVAINPTFEFHGCPNGLISSKPFAHVNHASFAISESTLKLLTLNGQFVLEGRRQAFKRCVALDHDTV